MIRAYDDYGNVVDLVERERQIRVEAIDECMTILKAQHMFRTCEDDYIPKIERPFYQKLWDRFKRLKEQKNENSNLDNSNS